MAPAHNPPLIHEMALSPSRQSSFHGSDHRALFLRQLAMVFTSPTSSDRARGRFIKQDHVRAHRQRARYRHALLLASDRRRG
jgi:hypothetical protein